MDRRVNHCAVRASAQVNGVQVHHIITYGGQQLNQTERDSCVFSSLSFRDSVLSASSANTEFLLPLYRSVYILTIKENTYTWTFVGKDLAGQPNGRAGQQVRLPPLSPSLSHV